MGRVNVNIELRENTKCVHCKGTTEAELIAGLQGRRNISGDVWSPRELYVTWSEVSLAVNK